MITILQKIQMRFGHLPEAAMRRVASHFDISEGQVFGVASFYAQSRFTPVVRARADMLGHGLLRVRCPLPLR